MKETNVNFMLGCEEKKKITEIADKQHRSLGAQIRLILEEYLAVNANAK